MAQAVMFVLALKSWPLRGQVTHSRLHAHKRHNSKYTQTRRHSAVVLSSSWSKTQNIVYDLLVNYAFVDPAFIDKSAWDAEQVGYLPRLYNTLVTTPTGVSKLLTELTEQVGFFLFWDEVNSLIKFQTIRPNSLSETVHELNTTKHLLADSVKMRDIVDDRVNEVWVYYGIIDSTKKFNRRFQLF